jgi:hypothetical protein
MKPFHICYWGGVRNHDVASRFLGTDQQDFWFDTAAERAAFRKRLQQFADSVGRCVVFVENDGELAQKQTFAVMLFKFNGKEYPLEYDFGIGYGAQSAEFMWEEGNYSCDCNRSKFLHEKYPEIPESDDCGDSIELISFKVEYRDPVELTLENNQQKDPS